jgi:NDP-sugar pyrophosphorylase family protein
MSIIESNPANEYSKMFDMFGIPEEQRNTDFFRIELGPDGKPYPIPTEININSRPYQLRDNGTAISKEADYVREDDFADVDTFVTSFGPRSIIHAIRTGGAVKIGADCELSDGVYIGNYSELGDEVKIGENSYISVRAKVGDNVKVGKRSRIGEHVQVSRDTLVGNNTRVESRSVLAARVILENNVNIWPKAVLGEAAVVQDHGLVGRESQIGHGSIVGKDARVKDGRKIKDGEFVAPHGYKPVRGDLY